MKTSVGEFGRFGKKLELDITLLDVDVSVLPWESKLPGRMDEEVRPYYRQSTKDLYRHFSSKHTISSFMGFADR